MKLEEGNEEVFGLDGVSSDEDDEEEVDLGIYKVENNEDIIEKEKYKEIDEKAWGKRRDIYYNADDADADDEIAKEEEYEALRLQKERIEQLNEEDFIDDSFAAKLSGKTGIVKFILCSIKFIYFYEIR
jgi:U3 small nucleolar RNA-associated protein 3